MIDPRGKAYGLAAAIFALDRLTKWIVESRVSFFDSYKAIPGFFEIVRTQNRGVAFGMFNDAAPGWRSALLAALTAAAVIAVGAVLWKARRLDARSRWGLALVLGGAAGNLTDRLAWGRVTDFLLFYIGRYQWPAFNLADSAIVIGSGLLALDAIRPKRQANVS
ncbi:MAG: signal peptidase II [Bryobacteraceae bacterium]|jgi:signal peptidase II